MSVTNGSSLMLLAIRRSASSQTAVQNVLSTESINFGQPSLPLRFVKASLKSSYVVYLTAGSSSYIKLLSSIALLTLYRNAASDGRIHPSKDGLRSDPMFSSNSLRSYVFNFFSNMSSVSILSTSLFYSGVKMCS